MKHRSPSLVSVFAAALLLALLAACPNPMTPARGGSLSVSINNAINARTLLPLLDMNAASYTVSGVGPSGATFSQSTPGGSLTVDALAFGSWSVTVNALNAGGTIIGSGQAAVTVHTGQTTTVDISVVPLTGNGTLSLTVTWPGSQVDSPSIQATLTPPSGPVIPLSFSVSGTQATYSSTTIPAGYKTLTLQLLANGTPVMGAVEVARIVAGQTTTGTYAFANVNQPGGSVQVNITPAMADPIPVSISGVNSMITAGTSVTAIASVSDGTANVTYVWYLNGLSKATSPSYTFGSTLAAGYYRLDVTAFTADGTRAGSATLSTTVGVGAQGTVLIPGLIQDFDVDSQGRVFGVSYDYATQNLTGTLVKRDGTTVASNVLIDQVVSPDFTDGLVQVNMSPQSGKTLVTWLTNPTGDFTQRQFNSRLFETNATAITPVFAWPSPASGNYVFDAAMDDSGAFVLLWQDIYRAPPGQKSYLSVYDNQGRKQGDDILVDDTGKIGGNDGFHVVLNPGDGSGIVTTQGLQSSPIYYRRFNSSHGFIDPSFQEVPYTSGNSSWYESHVVGMNRNGDFVIQWENYGKSTMEACFFDWSGALHNHVILGSLHAYGIDAFRMRHQKVESLSGNFVLRSDASPYTLWLYSPSGTKLGMTTTAADATKLRTNYGVTTYIPRPGSNAIDVASLQFN
jgi:hypothetical protein